MVAFRKHTLLPLDDCLYALQATRPQSTSRRSARKKASSTALSPLTVPANVPMPRCMKKPTKRSPLRSYGT